MATSKRYDRVEWAAMRRVQFSVSGITVFDSYSIQRNQESPFNGGTPTALDIFQSCYACESKHCAYLASYLGRSSW